MHKGGMFRGPPPPYLKVDSPNHFHQLTLAVTNYTHQIVERTAYRASKRVT